MVLEPDRVPAQPARPRRAKKLIGATLCLGVSCLSVVIAYRHVTHPERVRARIQQLLRTIVKGRVGIASADFNWPNELRILGLTIHQEIEGVGSGTHPEPVLELPSVVLRTIPWTVLSGRPRFDSVVISRATVRCARDAAAHRWNVSGLLDLGGMKPTDSAGVLPTLDLRELLVRIDTNQLENDSDSEEIRLTLRGRPSENGLNYDLSWESATGESGQLRAGLGLKSTTRVEGSLPSATVRTLISILDAGIPGLDKQADVIGLEGFARVRHLRVDASGANHRVGAATLDLRALKLSVPIDNAEQELPFSDRYLRFDNAIGTVQINSNQVTAEFKGRFHGAEMSFSAALSGDLATSRGMDSFGIEANFRAQGLELPRIHESASPAERRFVDHWPKLVEFYQDYDPHGRVDIDAVVRKPPDSDQSAARLQSLQLTSLGGDASCKYFPYRVRNLNGRIAVGPQGAVVENLCGEHGGGRICLNWQAERFDRCSAARVRVTGTHLPIDGELVASIPRAHQELRKEFNPEGTINVNLELDRAACSNGQPEPWRSQYEISFNGISAQYEHFPYPVHDIHGTFSENAIRQIDVRIAGRAGRTPVRVTGRAQCLDGIPGALELHLEADGMEFEPSLLDALPPSLRNAVELLQPTGNMDVRAQITRGRNGGGLAPVIEIELQDVSVRPPEWGMYVENLHGRLDLDQHRVSATGLHGCIQGADIEFNGSASLSTGAAELSVQLSNLNCNESVRSALPEEIQAAMHEWVYDGPITASAAVRYQPETTNANPLVWDARIELDRPSTLHHPSLRRALHDIRGNLKLDNSEISGQYLTARLGDGTFEGSVQIYPSGAETRVELCLEADGLQLEGPVRDLLPPSATSEWKSMGPSGSVDIRIKSLKCLYSAFMQWPTCQLDSEITLRANAFHGTTALERVTGRFQVMGELFGAQGGTSLVGTLEFPSAVVYGNPVSGISGSWSVLQPIHGPRRITVDLDHAKIHEGSFSTQIELETDTGQTSYDLAALLYRVPIEPFIQEVQSPRAANSEPMDVGGWADARLRLSGIMGNASTRRGVGGISISDARLYRTPLLVAIVNVLNLTVPSEEAFDEVQAEFYIMGSRLELSEVSLRGKGLALLGSGTISWPDQTVDLFLYQVSPHWWTQIPLLTDIVEGATRELVELHVTGPLSRPSVRPRALRGLTDEIKNLIQKKKAKPIQPSG